MSYQFPRLFLSIKTCTRTSRSSLFYSPKCGYRTTRRLLSTTRRIERSSPAFEFRPVPESRSSDIRSLSWSRPPKRVLLVHKLGDKATIDASRNVIEHILQNYPSLSIIVEQNLASCLGLQHDSIIPSDDLSKLCNTVDLVIGIGGDGTALRISSLFSSITSSPKQQQQVVPPVIGLSLGHLGFLMPFTPPQFPAVLRHTLENSASVRLRMRLQASIDRHHDDNHYYHDNISYLGKALNEIHLHRGSHPHMAIIDTYVNDQHITEAVADGLIVATPTGSTAYNLSAGGPLVHPSLPSISLTPICPRSLSFRSLLLPPNSNIRLEISKECRSSVEVSLDGRGGIQPLQPGHSIQIQMSQNPIPCVVDSKSDDWVSDVNNMLSFNRKFLRKPF